MNTQLAIFSITIFILVYLSARLSDAVQQSFPEASHKNIGLQIEIQIHREDKAKKGKK